ncbi:hypothetical protein NDU88_006688 [Pleurodeles waltl]|uniref:Uncharacterized protein n=1 Tax=Pleurodeles waltl TaxID=8319 RepID=A0AAV7PKE6_PLEWA|nr:hypothetical protein NDU88_006688 [Pleurodeles waltl]
MGSLAPGAGGQSGGPFTPGWRGPSAASSSHSSRSPCGLCGPEAWWRERAPAGAELGLGAREPVVGCLREEGEPTWETRETSAEHRCLLVARC